MKMTRARSAHSPAGIATVNATMSATGSNAAATAAQKTVYGGKPAMYPTTIRGMGIDLVSNFKVQPLEQDQQDNPPMTLHFTDHKAVILKGKRNTELKVIYGDDE